MLPPPKLLGGCPLPPAPPHTLSTPMLNYSKSADVGFFSRRLNNEFETAVVNEPSVFEPVKVCCSCIAKQVLSSLVVFHKFYKHYSQHLISKVESHSKLLTSEGKIFLSQKIYFEVSVVFYNKS